MMTSLQLVDLIRTNGPPDNPLQNGEIDIASSMGTIGTLQLDGNFTFSTNMSVTMESLAQNATLSNLSGQILAFGTDDPNILENVTSTCTYTFTAYEYTPYRLFVPYGVAIFVTILCTIWGSVAARRNGVEESMDFSRFLRAVLNERMFSARAILDEDTKVKADDTTEGKIAPLNYR